MSDRCDWLPRSCWLLAWWASPLVACAADPSPGDLDFFESRIRPVLVAHCYECHGPEKEVKGGLRLDTRHGWQTGGDSGPAIVPGKPDDSLLLQALRYDPNFVEMPPRGKLPENVIRDFETWIAKGAADPREADPASPSPVATTAKPAAEHWAYQPIQKRPAPPVRNEAWARDEIDRFILARLEAAGLEPALDAEPEVLARRLSFDLVGLPPTPEQIDALAAGDSAAIERYVDELIATPQFGERWGRHWLDIVRYGESLTLRGLVLPDAWRFRDYVIEAFNHDRPIDQVIREHVAGDLLSADSVAERQRQCVASTFLTMGNWNLEEQDKPQLRMDVVDEQLDTLGKAFLAQTIGCARCHDHKFDPIPTRDYYALAGILRNTKTLEDANVSKWLERPLPVEPEEEYRLAQHEAAVADLAGQVARLTEQIAALDPQSKRPDVVPLESLSGVVVDDQAARAVGVWTTSQSNKPYIGRGYVHDNHELPGEKTLTFEPKLPGAGHYEVRLAYTPGSNRASNAPITVFSAEGEKTISVDQRQTPPVDRHWVSLGIYRFEQDGQCFVIVGNEAADGHVVADAVQFLPAEKGPPSAPAATEVAAASELDSASAASLKQARGELSTLKRQLAELRAQGPARPHYVGVAEEPTITETFVHIRGSVHQLGEPVQRGFLSAVPVTHPPQLPSQQSGRVELGEWLTHAENPLTARVYVNRVWHWLFGAGIVRTTDNFGVAGEVPSHPELLDYLAAEFRADGWSTKRLIRRIVLSRTYRLASAGDPGALAVDPENRLLGRMNRRRLDAECLRDAMLTLSGELDLTVGGTTLTPKTVADYDYEHDHLRRGVYCAVLRNRLPELFEVFDFADTSVVTGCRSVSTVAPQALFLLNDPFVVARARQAAVRISREPGLAPEARIKLAFRRALGRRPHPAELQLVTRQLEAADDPESADAWQPIMHALIASLDFRYVD